MNTVFRKLMMFVLVVSLAFAGLPLSSAYAAAPGDLPTPQATPKLRGGTLLLEQVFAKQTKVVAKAGKLYEHLDQGFSKLQGKIDKAKARGVDVAAVQAALDAVKKNLTDARPLYDQAKSIVAAHNGFDANGKVTDAAAARETVKSLREIRKQFKDTMGSSVKTLHETIKALRQAK